MFVRQAKNTTVDLKFIFSLVFTDESEKDFVGQIRFKRKSGASTECDISLSITESFRGKHIARDFLELGIEELKKYWYSVNTVVAEVKDENAASNRLFIKEGFKLVSKVNTYKLNISEILRGGGICNFNKICYSPSFKAGLLCA